MTEEFAFNARQYFDFSQEQEELSEDSYFEINRETEDDPLPRNQPQEAKTNSEEIEMSDTESDSVFFSPAVFTQTTDLPTNMRRSLSLNNLPAKEIEKTGPERPNNQKFTSKESINRLAQPKHFTSSENIYKNHMTVAEAVYKFQTNTPERFRSRPSLRTNQMEPFHWGGTRAQSPKLRTAARARPVAADVISKEEQEKLELEEMRKFKIKANPINKRALRGPVKPQVDKKPLTAVEPFNLTEIKKRDQIQESKAPVFKAQPLPKSLYNPFKIQETMQTTTKAQTPRFVKRLSKNLSKSDGEKVNKFEAAPKAFKPTRTKLAPFSFEKRDQQLQKRKEEFVNKVLEEEKKAREFHAKPVPKSVLRTHNHSSETCSLRSFKRSTEELETITFKARQPTVLTMKPFEPKKDENHILKIEAFQFATDHRIEARQKFDQQQKEKQEKIAAMEKNKEELLKKMEEEEVARIRKQAEHKAQPIRKYKEIKIVKSNKVTEPVSPQFHTDRQRNKENIAAK